MRDFFGCPRRKININPETVSILSLRVNNKQWNNNATLSLTTTSTSTTTTTTTTTTSSTTISTSISSNTELINDELINLQDNSILPHQQNSNKISSTVIEHSGNDDNNNRLKSANVFLSSSSDQSNQIYSSVFLRNTKAKILPVSSNGSISTNQLIPPLVGGPGVTLRESDSILLTIFIGIVISACIATIILAFLTITGRNR